MTSHLPLLFALLIWVNFLPPLARLVWGERFALPVDGGLRFADGRPLLGPHKTWRGLVFALCGSLLFVPFLPLAWYQLVAVAGLALCGDLATSFVKRRLGWASGREAFFLDQFLEGLLPSLYGGRLLGATLTESLLLALIFVPAAFLGSRLWAFLNYQPPERNRLRIVRAPARVRQWRACHQPLARWQLWLNFEHVLWYRLVMGWFFRAAGLYQRGQTNALEIEVVERVFYLENLPEPFDGCTILLLTDLHLDGIPGLTDRIVSLVEPLAVDLCLVGGDIRMETYGPVAPALRRLKRLVSHLRVREGVFGVLGNHDCIEMVPELEDAGVVMLVNDAWPLERQGQTLWLVGVDDPHFYKVHDLEAAFKEVPAGACAILLVHSPELYHDASRFQPALYLCGHTHGGQVCLPGGGRVFTHCRAPRPLCAGPWRYRGMWGYTCRGAGASGLPLRFNCPGEITHITLRRGKPPA